MDGLVESTGQSTENYDVVLLLRYGSEGVSEAGVGGAYPVRLGFEVGEAGDTFHEIGRELVPVLNNSNTLYTRCSLRNVSEMLETYLR